ncbi:MAG: FKBP-type peptidyl-prolyl cis-trans isomerase [Candidatus Paceibacterota bacterium]|jgi:FKBP-type peptidyl-prolyl cis-trans isomerase
MQEENTNKNNMNIVLAVVICLVFLGVLVFISMNNKVNNENMPSNNNVNDIANNVSDNTIPAENTIPAGDIAKTGDTVSVNYTGRLENGTVFDSNVDIKFNHVQPFEFKLGGGQVIPGWDKGIVGMKVGEKKTLIIKPEDAYGATGVGRVIPPNATLIFDVELLAIK